MKSTTRVGTQPIQHVVTEPRDYRKELWIKIATATAGASNCTKIEAPITWADKALAAFDERFPQR
jgi:hypothetical protein